MIAAVNQTLLTNLREQNLEAEATQLSLSGSFITYLL